MQEYVPTLQTVGEWQTFIVNGSVIHTIHTYKTPDSRDRCTGGEACIILLVVGGDEVCVGGYYCSTEQTILGNAYATMGRH